MHINIAIPTYNRIKPLKKCLDSIFSQELDTDIKLSISLSNTASTDQTFEYLKNLSNKNNMFHISNVSGLDTEINCGTLAQTIPGDADWVWLMGDDDYFRYPNTINFLAKLIKHANNDDLSFIHACQDRRSTNTNNVYKGTVLELCELFGYYEMLGWFSSIITRPEIMISALLHHQKEMNLREKFATSAFNHSAEFLKLLFDKSGLFIDHPFADPQDQKQTSENVLRWNNMNINERYFFTIDDILKMHEDGILKNLHKPTFFRYHNIHIWDRLILQQIHDLPKILDITNNSEKNYKLENFNKNWKRLFDLSKIIEESDTKEKFKTELLAAENFANSLIENKFSNGLNRIFLNKQTNRQVDKTYDFEILDKTIRDKIHKVSEISPT